MIKLLLPLCFFLVSCSSIQYRYHHVLRGESLWSIAKKYSVPVDVLRDENSAHLGVGLKPGMKIYIPFEENPSWNMPEYGEGKKRSEVIPIAYDINRIPLSWPVKGAISSYFGKRKLKGRRHWERHEGIDIAALGGTPVRASRSGHVIYVGRTIRGYGNMVILKHADVYSTVYAHLMKFHVRKGQFVSRGQLLGRVGRTGRATNYHLHFEVRNGARPINPLHYLYKSRQYASLQ